MDAIRFTLITLYSLFFISACERLKAPVESHHSQRVYLENQKDHSGITVQVVEADIMVFTASDGSYSLPPLRDGIWTVRAYYPYYKAIEQKVIIKNGLLTQPIGDITLRQEICFAVFTDRPLYTLGDIVQITLITTNISDFTVKLHTGSRPMRAFVIRRNGYTIAGGLHPGPAMAVVDKTFEPGAVDTTYLSWDTQKYPPPEPGIYKIYAVLTADGIHDGAIWLLTMRYFQPVILGDTVWLHLNESLFSKLNPAIITIIE